MRVASDAGETPHELPPPTPELILLSSLTRAYLRRLPKSERRAFLKDVTDDLQWQAEMAAIVRIRPESQDEEVAEKRRAAHAWWRQALGLLLMQLDR